MRAQDNTGYDLKQLLVGSEGTLGVITAAAIQCPPRPASVHVAYLAVPSFANVQQARLPALASAAPHASPLACYQPVIALWAAESVSVAKRAARRQVFVRARRRLGEILSAFEFLDRGSLELTQTELEGVRDPLPGSVQPFYLVVETSGSNAEHDYAKLEARAPAFGALCQCAKGKRARLTRASVCVGQAFLEEVMEEGLVADGTLAQDSTQVAGIWGLREGISVALKHAGAPPAAAPRPRPAGGPVL